MASEPAADLDARATRPDPTRRVALEGQRSIAGGRVVQRARAGQRPDIRPDRIEQLHAPLAQVGTDTAACPVQQCLYFRWRSRLPSPRWLVGRGARRRDRCRRTVVDQRFEESKRRRVTREEPVADRYDHDEQERTEEAAADANLPSRPR